MKGKGQKGAVTPLIPSVLSLPESNEGGLTGPISLSSFPNPRTPQTATGKELLPDVPKLTEAWCGDDCEWNGLFPIHWEIAYSLSMPLYGPSLNSN